MTGRRIVVHHCDGGFPPPALFRKGDVAFFDDCLLSQYRYLKDNLPAMKGVRVVLGFSPGLARPPDAEPIWFMESQDAHRAVNAAMRRAGDAPPPEIGAFMSAGEVLELAGTDGVEVAMHGCVHLRLEDEPSRTARLGLFRRDAEDGAALFRRYGLRLRVFVYPYAFCEDGYELVLERLGFVETWGRPGAYRTAAEDMADERAGREDS